MSNTPLTPQVQEWNASHYAEHANFVPTLGNDVMKLLAPQPGQRILDLGCGDGALTERIMQLGADVLGVDASAEMVAAAQQRGVTARVVDGHQLPFDRTFCCRVWGAWQRGRYLYCAYCLAAVSRY